MNFGVSTSCFYPDLLENSAKRIAKMNIPFTEVFFNSFSEVKKDYLLKLKGILGDTKALSIHPFSSGFETFMLFSDYERRADDLIELYKYYFEACNLFGAEVLVLHGAYSTSNCSYDRYFERYFRLFEAGKSFGVMVAQENVARCKSGDIEFLKEMKTALGENVKFTLDLKQGRRSGIKALELIKVLGENICHVHISDGDETDECLAIGEGNEDFEKFFKALRDINYDKGVILELYRRNFEGEKELFESYEKLLKF